MDQGANQQTNGHTNETEFFQGDLFGGVQLIPTEPIWAAVLAYMADTSKDKMNLGVGVYRDENEKPYPFKVVRKVELALAQDLTLDKEYLPTEGLPQFTEATKNLIFGKDSKPVKEGRILTAQAMSGTGALSLAFEFLAKFMPNDIYVSNPTWGIHLDQIKRAGLNLKTYPYYNEKTKSLDWDGLYRTISEAKQGSIILLHACAHNPTGIDLTEDQWKQLAALMKEKKLFPFLDSAYQGFASGDLLKDSYSIRLFADLDFQLIVTQSFAKNLGLYNERIGAVHIVTSSKEAVLKCSSQLRNIIRLSYSSPPAHGARVVTKILTDPTLFNEWLEELKIVSQRVIQMREALKSELIKLEVPGNWDHITTQIGIFSFTGLTPEQCDILINKYHIYLLRTGRISMCGVTTKNVNYLARAIKDAVESTQNK